MVYGRDQTILFKDQTFIIYKAPEPSDIFW